jgi:hypothetical protein
MTDERDLNLARDDPEQAAKELDAAAARDRARGDQLGELTAALREDAADRLRGGPGTIPQP